MACARQALLRPATICPQWRSTQGSPCSPSRCGIQLRMSCLAMLSQGCRQPGSERLRECTPGPLTSRGPGRGGKARCAGGGRDKLCREQVNVPTQVVSPTESQAERCRVTLLGAKGSSQTIEVPQDVYILDAAIDQNIDLPWSCRGGICGTCVGKVVKGSVDQSDISDLEFVLGEEDVNNGMTLLCMARPKEDCTIETQSDWGYLMGFQEWKGATGNIGETVAADWKSISDG